MNTIHIPSRWGSHFALQFLLWTATLCAGAAIAQDAQPELTSLALNPTSQPVIQPLSEPLEPSPLEQPQSDLVSAEAAQAPVLSLSEYKAQGLQVSQATEVISPDPQQIEGVSTEAAIAEEQSSAIAPVNLAQPIPLLPAATLKPLHPVAQLTPASVLGSTKALGRGKDLSQVTSVSQLSDVQPTDWAFQALQSLVERYGCIAGYPNRTYRGNRPLTRYEFAAGLNACMDRVNELIASATADKVTKDDLATIKKLQDEFAGELAALKGRVDALEARTKTLEAQQFSTTTKLSGLVWFNLTAAGAGRNVRVETVDPAGLFGRIELRQPGRDLAGRPIVTTVKNPQPTFSNLVWLTLNTSFTGKDQLVTQLASGNGESPANIFASSGAFNTFGTPFTDQTAGVQGIPNDVIIRELFYSFPVTKNLQIVAGPAVNWYRYFDNNAFTFFLTGSASFNSIGSTLTNTVDRGSGVVALWNINNKLKFHAAYLGENAEFLPAGLFKTAADPRKGLFGGTWTATAELTYSPTKKVNIRLLYTRSQIQALNGLIGGVTGEPLQNGLVDAGAGRGLDINPADGGLKDSQANTFGLSFDWLITPRFGIYGRYGYANTRLQPIKRNVEVQSIQAGLAFPDLGKKGALGTISFLVPFDIMSGKRYFVSGIGDGGTQYDIEASYFYPITQNIAIVPAFYTILNANNFSSNPAIFVGNFRTQFSF